MKGKRYRGKPRSSDLMISSSEWGRLPTTEEYGNRQRLLETSHDRMVTISPTLREDGRSMNEFYHCNCKLNVSRKPLVPHRLCRYREAGTGQTTCFTTQCLLPWSTFAPSQRSRKHAAARLVLSLSPRDHIVGLVTMLRLLPHSIDAYGTHCPVFLIHH